MKSLALILNVSLLTISAVFPPTAAASQQAHWVRLPANIGYQMYPYMDVANVVSADPMRSANIRFLIVGDNGTRKFYYHIYAFVVVNCANGAVDFSDVAGKDKKPTDLVMWNMNKDDLPRVDEGTGDMRPGWDMSQDVIVRQDELTGIAAYHVMCGQR